jgi:hemolysin activation/secretion protein
MRGRSVSVALRLIGPACALATLGAAAQTGLPRDNPIAPPELARPSYLPAGPSGTLQLPALAAPSRMPLPVAAGEKLTSLVMRGNVVISTEDLLEVAAPWIGQPANAADLEALRIALTRHYVDRGYVNSGVRIDPAGLRSGVLDVEVVEGRLSSLRLTGLDGLDEAYVTSRLWPDAHEPLQLQSLRERYQLLLDDPLIQRMNARMLPDAGPGTAALDVAVERAQPWSFSVRLNNHRPASVGERALVLDAGYRNLTGRGDSLRLTAQPEENVRGFARLGLGWSVPLLHPGTLLSVQFDDSDSNVVEEPLASADIKSRLRSRDIMLSHVLIENLRHRAAVGAAWADRRSETWLAGERFAFIAGVPDEGLRARSLRLWQEYTYRAENQVFAVRSTFTRTRNNIAPLATETAPEVVGRSARFWLGQAQYARRLSDEGLQLVARATVQHTRDRLVSLDGLSIGGLASVRGWRENQLVRDRGAILNLELDIPVLQSSATRSRLHLIPFLDYGRGRHVTRGSDSIGSVGLALRWRSGPWAADAAWGWRVMSTLDKSRAGKALQDYGLHFQLSYSLGR